MYKMLKIFLATLISILFATTLILIMVNAGGTFYSRLTGITAIVLTFVFAAFFGGKD